MSKKSPKRMYTLEEVIKQEGHLTAPAPNPQPAPYRPPVRPLSLSLDDMRRAAMREHDNIAHTIADLEGWRAEIESTIAFLKSRR
jgi:hypothetical protein